MNVTNEDELETEIIEDMAKHLPCGVMLIDEAFNVYYMSEKAEEILDLNKGIFSCCKLTRYFLFDEHGLESEGDITQFTKFYTSKKGLVSIHYKTKPMKGGKFLLYLKGKYDGSDAAVKNENNLNGFVSTITHEIRTPINIISNAASLIYSMSKDKEKSSKHLKIIQKNTNIILRLVANLLTMCKDEEVGLTCDFHKDNIISTLRTSVLAIEDFVKSHGIKIKQKIEIREAIAVYDPDMLDKILVNLISNAIKFSNKENEIEVIAKKKDSHTITISVKDNGIGISEENQKTIFDKYKQVNTMTIIKNQGSGIGLYIVKTLAEKMGFHINCNSELGYGSEFILEVPASGIVEGLLLSDQKLYISSPVKNQKYAIEFADCF